MATEFSEAALLARPKFYSGLNSIQVFVEDTDVSSRKFYSILIGRVLGTEVPHDCIHPLGGRGNVVRVCQSDQGERSVPAVYLIDGDVGFVAGEKPPQLRRLFVLPAYCVENFLIDKNAIAALLFEETEELIQSAVDRALDFQGWIDEIGEHLVELYLRFSVIATYAPHHKTVSTPVSDLMSAESKRKGSVCPVAVSAVSHGCDTAICKVLQETEYESLLMSLREGVGERFPDREMRVLRLVSGKSVLLPLLQARIQGKFRFGFKLGVLRIRLAMRCSVDEISGIRAVLE